PHPAARSTAPAAPGPTGPDGPVGTSTLGLGGWQVLSSARTTATGAAVSAPGFTAQGWLAVRPDDAGAPGTEIEALLQNGACPEVFYSTNMEKCFGYEKHIGADTVPEFDVPWWFRTDFTAALGTGQHATLIVPGVVGQADLWLDGRELATRARIEGDYTRFTFDVTRRLRRGENALAFEVFPNDPLTMFTLDDVDWSQIPPDNNTGIQFPVKLQTGDAITVGDDDVTQVDTPDMSSAALTVQAAVTNAGATPRSARVTAVITPPATAPPTAAAATPVDITTTVTVPARTTTTVVFSPARFPALTLEDPELWWPYQMGGQPLYTLSVSALSGGSTATAATATFGIRTVTSTLVGPSALAPDGVRRFSVNGVPFLVRGGGFAENLFLHYSSSDIATQITLIKSLGLNVVRTEGKEMPDDFYRQMDRAGIMIDAGFQCCDRWQLPADGRGVTAKDYSIMYLSALTIGQRLRNHPSVIDYSWSDDAPAKKQESLTLAAFARVGFDDPVISSAEYNASPILGVSGEKEGPYDWVPPSYWYDTSHSSTAPPDDDPTLTDVGGSWGFDSEQSAGDTVPTMDSIERFLSPADQAALWQDPSFNQYHTNYEPGHTGYRFGTLFNLDEAVDKRYGPWTSLAQYVEEAQVQNYEDTRAQFEAFIDHWNATPTPATGTIYWMLNKGWPSLLWDLYNEDDDEAGSFFGAQEANAPVHALYSYDDGTVGVDNLTGTPQSGLAVEARVYALDGTLLDDENAAVPTLDPQAVADDVLTPKVPAATKAPATASVYFVELLLRRGTTVVDRNVYWLSTQPDVVNWKATEGKPQGVMSEYADLTALRSLPAATTTVTASTATAGTTDTTTVTVTNTSTSATVAFFVRADVRRGTAAGRALAGDNEVLPIVWSANDITLWPGESETLTATYAAVLLDGAAPVVSVSGWNVAPVVVAAQ
ncbi:MAG: glycosyl hydrolase 2 galactose-binding domain-containing protein, partial [Acidimicrobiales bacterium]